MAKLTPKGVAELIRLQIKSLAGELTTEERELEAELLGFGLPEVTTTKETIFKKSNLPRRGLFQQMRAMKEDATKTVSPEGITIRFPPDKTLSKELPLLRDIPSTTSGRSRTISLEDALKRSGLTLSEFLREITPKEITESAGRNKIER